jgi:hypothetical protein
MVKMVAIMTMSKRDNTKPAFTPKRPEIPHTQRPQTKETTYYKSIIIDPIHPKDFREVNIAYCCEQCSYYSPSSQRCAMGFKVEKHQKAQQLKLYHLTGKMALCRSLEVD